MENSRTASMQPVPDPLREARDRRQLIDEIFSALAGMVAGSLPGGSVIVPLARAGARRLARRSASAMFERELAALTDTEERNRYLDQIKAIVVQSIDEAQLRLTRTQLRLKDEVAAELAVLSSALDRLHSEMKAAPGAPAHVVEIAVQTVTSGAVGVQVDSGSRGSVRLEEQNVSGLGSIGVALK